MLEAGSGFITADVDLLSSGVCGRASLARSGSLRSRSDECVRPYGIGVFSTVSEGCAAPDGIELYQSILRVKYITAATARKLATAPTSSALSSRRSNR